MSHNTDPTGDDIWAPPVGKQFGPSADAGQIGGSNDIWMHQQPAPGPHRDIAFDQLGAPIMAAPVDPGAHSRETTPSYDPFQPPYAYGTPPAQPTRNSLRVPEAKNHLVRNTLVVALLGVVASGGLLAYRSQHGTNPATDYSQPYEKRLSSEATDPAFRAEAVTLLRDGLKMGSASLVRRGDGQISVLTVEHVARPFSGLPSTIAHPAEGPVVDSTVPDEGDMRFYIPSIGTIENDAEPELIGPDKDDRGNVADRVALYSLTTDQQNTLAVAVATGSLEIPTISSEQPTFGDVLTMPSPNLGKEIKLVYISQDADTYKLVPLVMLDDGMDVTKGLAHLANQQKTEESKSRQAAVQASAKYLKDHGFSVPSDDDQIIADARDKTHFYQDPPTPEQILTSALQSLQTQFADKYDQTKADPERRGQAVADNTVCYGDSGGPLIGKDKKVMGVLMGGDPLITSKDDPVLLTRVGQNPLCLGVASFTKLGS